MIATRIEEATRLEDIQYLWKTDDAEWLRQRKEEWLYLKKHSMSEGSAKELKINANYFIYGKKEEYIGELLLYLFTPYSNSSEALKVFNLDSMLSDGQRKVVESLVFSAAKWCEGMPWLKSHIENFVAGVLGDDFDEIKKSVNFNLGAGAWCLQYLGNTIRYLDSEMSYHGVESSMGFFISALDYCHDKPKWLAEIEKNYGNLFQSAEKYLLRSVENGSKHRFAQELLNRKEEILTKINEASKKVGG